MSHGFFPPYFVWWHIPVIFLAGLIGESYGCIIGGGSILLLATQNFIGVPLKSAVAINNAAALGTEFGILSETHRYVIKNKRIVLLMMLPITLGGAIGTRLLLVLSPEVIKLLIIAAVLALLIYTYAGKNRTSSRKVAKPHYTMLYVFLFLTGLYSNFVSLGGGTFSKLAIISVLGLTFIQGQGLSAAVSLPARIYSLVVTSIAGLIVWPYLITFWVSTYIAGKYSTKFVKHVPDKFLKAALTLVCIIFIFYLLFVY